MSNIKPVTPVTKDDIVNGSHLFDQLNLLQKNMLFITTSTIRVLKNTVLKDMVIKTYRPTQAICQLFKFITLNLCGKTELTKPLETFFSVITRSILPSDLENISLETFKNLYKNQIREKKLDNTYNDVSDLDEKSVSNLRQNLVTFINSVSEYYPEINIKRPIKPLCEISTFVTQAACEHRYFFVPFVVFMSLLTHFLIPQDIINEIVKSLKISNIDRPDMLNAKYGGYKKKRSHTNNNHKNTQKSLK
jgi:hypothetical protein